MVSDFFFEIRYLNELGEQGVGGGAWYPSAQGALADKASTRRSYLVPMSGYIAMLIYAVYVVLCTVLTAFSSGFCSGLVIDQKMHGGFRFWNVDDSDKLRSAAMGGGFIDSDIIDANYGVDSTGQTKNEDCESESLKKNEAGELIEVV